MALHRFRLYKMAKIRKHRGNGRERTGSGTEKRTTKVKRTWRKRGLKQFFLIREKGEENDFIGQMPK